MGVLGLCGSCCGGGLGSVGLFWHGGSGRGGEERRDGVEDERGRQKQRRTAGGWLYRADAVVCSTAFTGRPEPETPEEWDAGGACSCTEAASQWDPPGARREDTPPVGSRADNARPRCLSGNALATHTATRLSPSTRLLFPPLSHTDLHPGSAHAHARTVPLPRPYQDQIPRPRQLPLGPLPSFSRPLGYRSPSDHQPSQPNPGGPWPDPLSSPCVLCLLLHRGHFASLLTKATAPVHHRHRGGHPDFSSGAVPRPRHHATLMHRDWPQFTLIQFSSSMGKVRPAGSPG